MTSIGEKFRKLRKEQNITLVQASKGICDPSNLSRWENGKITLEFNKVLALLNHIHVTPTEFINYAKLKQENEIPQEYIEAIDKEDNAQIKTLALKQLKIYHTKRKQLFCVISIYSLLGKICYHFKIRCIYILISQKPLFGPVGT